MAFSITDIIIICIILLFTIFGAVKGILAKALGLINIGLAAVISYYVAAPLSSLFVDTEFYQNIFNTLKDWTPVIFLVVIFIIFFVIILIVLNLFSKIIIKAVSKGNILGFFNKLIGACLGFATGLLIATIYLLIFYGLAQVSTNIQAFYVNDLHINSNDFTLSKMLMNYTMTLFNSIGK